ncbi:MAG: hypothetical protein LQ347_006040, partial [Umbilicaria vellea]
MEPEEPEHHAPGLQFNEPLSWRAGKPIAVADLLRRLQALSMEMRDMEQEENERESFTHVAKELASPNLLAHKDKGVKAWTACCLVDILRLCAPDAPYTGQQLRASRRGQELDPADIFTMLITSIFPALSDPSNAYNNQHMYVLQSLAQVKSIVLLTDIPSSESLTLHLFTSFFDILSGSSKSSTGEQLGKNVEFNMTQILVILVDESTNLPSEVVDIVVAQFLRTDPRAVRTIGGKGKKNGATSAIDDRQATLVLKELPPAYNMAKTICNTCPEKMARYVSQYFNDVILDASASSTGNGVGKDRSHRRKSDDLDESDDDLPSGPTEDGLKELNKAHRLLRELWRASPAVLQNVIPQLEAELSAENVQLRLLATQTLGDIVSGIGAAGPPPPPIMDPAAYPPVSLSSPMEIPSSQNLLTTPSSPQPFPQAHPQAYSHFLGRRQDKSTLIRSAWTTGIGHILSTSAGGVGLSQHDEQRLVSDLARMLGDADEKVRIAAVKAVSNFSFRDVIQKLGSVGGITTNGSVLATLAERVRDRKHHVRVEAMRVLARIWGVAAGEVAAGNEQVLSIIGAAPSKILDTFYANDMEINVLLDHVSFELLLPLGYPPIKAKAAKASGSNSQRVKDSQTNGDGDSESADPDKIRTERILVLVKQLDDKAKKVFFAVQSRQVTLAKIVTAYLQRCEDYNGGVMDENEKQIKDHLTRLIESLSKILPDPSRVSSDLWKFAKMHDRRSYQLIRFCMTPESDYRTVYKAIKEFTKRVEAAPNAPAGLLDTLIPLLYRTSIIVYNKSHVPAIMEYSRTDEKELASTAHEILKEISSRTPEVLKAHVQEICRILQEQAPTHKKPNDAGAVDDLKACAAFAQRFAKEIPQDRRFVQAMTSFALHGTPPEAAKYAVSIMMATSDKKELLARDLVTKSVQDFKYGSEGFLSRLATLSQLVFLVSQEVDEEIDDIIDIAIKQILLQVRTPSSTADYIWSEAIDDECAAKCWALKILVNRLRSHQDDSTLPDTADPVYILLSTLIKKEGELSNTKHTPASHKPRLRLLAARSFLKLCTSKPHDALLTPAAFNALAEVAQDPLLEVRSSFLQRLKKYAAQSKLPQRFYTIPFLLAFEPVQSLKSETATWIRSRAAFFSTIGTHQKGAAKASTVMESVFARLLSLLAHHPDFADTADDLLDFARYIIFYLVNVANPDNVSLIYHVAQRVKQCSDVISATRLTNGKLAEVSPIDPNLYHLSDLAQLVINKFADAHSWSIQTLPAKIRLPSSLFVEIKHHEFAVRIAEKNYLPEPEEGSSMEDKIEALVRASLRAGRTSHKKRKSDADDVGEHRPSKKAKSESHTKGKGAALPIRKASKATATKTPKAKKVVREQSSEVPPSSERRRSGRVQTSAVSGKYAERDDSEDDEEMELLNEEEGKDEAEDEEEEAEEEEEEDEEEEEEEEDDKAGEEDAHVEAEVEVTPAPTINGDDQDGDKRAEEPTPDEEMQDHDADSNADEL